MKTSPDTSKEALDALHDIAKRSYFSSLTDAAKMIKRQDDTIQALRRELEEVYVETSHKFYLKGLMEARTVTQDQADALVRMFDVAQKYRSTVSAQECAAEALVELDLTIIDSADSEGRECKMCGGTGTHIPEEEAIRKGADAPVYNCRYCKERAEALQELARLGQEWEAEGRECDCPVVAVAQTVLGPKKTHRCQKTGEELIGRCILKGEE